MSLHDTDTDTDTDTDIDETWINEFKKNEEVYNDFYKDKVEQIKLFYLYVSSSNIVEFIKKDSILLDADSILKKNKIITLILQNKFYNNIKYKLLSLIRFNINIEPEEINDFIYKENTQHYLKFITSEKYLNDIKYSDTIHIFQDLNCLYFIFYEEKQTKLKNDTIKNDTIKNDTIKNNTIKNDTIKNNTIKNNTIKNNNDKTHTKKLVSINTNKYKKTRRNVVRT